MLKLQNGQQVDSTCKHMTLGIGMLEISSSSILKRMWGQTHHH